MASKTRACQHCRPLLKQPQRGGRSSTIPPASLPFKYLCLRLLGGFLSFAQDQQAKQLQLKFLSPQPRHLPLVPPTPHLSCRPPSNLIFSYDWISSSSARASFLTFLLNHFKGNCFIILGEFWCTCRQGVMLLPISGEKENNRIIGSVF